MDRFQAVSKFSINNVLPIHLSVKQTTKPTKGDTSKAAQTHIHTIDTLTPINPWWNGAVSWTTLICPKSSATAELATFSREGLTVYSDRHFIVKLFPPLHLLLFLDHSKCSVPFTVPHILPESIHQWTLPNVPQISSQVSMTSHHFHALTSLTLHLHFTACCKIIPLCSPSALLFCSLHTIHLLQAWPSSTFTHTHLTTLFSLLDFLHSLHMAKPSSHT